MEYRSSPVNFGRPGAAGEGLPTDDYAPPVAEHRPEDDFECTYFRKRAARNPVAVRRDRGQFAATASRESQSDVSDEYTDSESESDNTSNVERWLESLPTKDAWSSVPNDSIDEQDWRLKKIDESNEYSVINDASWGSRGNGTKEVRFDEAIEIVGKNRAGRFSSTPFRDTIENVSGAKKSSEKRSRVRGKSLEIAEKRTRARKDLFACDDVMEELVNRLLTVSTTRREESKDAKMWSRRSAVTKGTESSVSRGKKRPGCESMNGESRAKAARVSNLEKWKGKGTAQKPRNKVPKLNSRRGEKARDRMVAAPKRKPARRNRSALTNRLSQQKSLPQPRYKIADESVDPESFSETCRRVRFTGVDENDAPVTSGSSRTRVARNKRFARKIEQMAQDFRSSGRSSGRNLAEDAFFERDEAPESIGSSSQGAKESSSWERERGETTANNAGCEIEKPIFANPIVEKSLDKAMEVALNKYKRSRDTWESLSRKKSRGNASLVFYEPPIKKQRPRSSGSKTKQTIRRDFSALDSWQSIHKYFLSYSPYN